MLTALLIAHCLVTQVSEPSVPAVAVEAATQNEVGPQATLTGDVAPIAQEDAARREASGVDAALSDEPLVALPPRSRRPAADEMLDELLPLPADSAPEGRNVALADVLQAASTRPRQIEATHAYWQLARAAARYAIARDAAYELQQMADIARDAASLGGPLASARAERSDAEFELLNAQYRLLEVAGLSTSERLPLSADRPHTGAYDTKFREVYAGRVAPANARLIDRTLPIEKAAIDARAQSVQAARDAFDAALEGYREGRLEFAMLLPALKAWAGERKEFVEQVIHYNDAIADYALAALASSMRADDLAATLIRSPLPATTTAGAGRPTASIPDTGVERATYEEPLTPTTPTEAPRSDGPQEPTLAPPELDPEYQSSERAADGWDPRIVRRQNLDNSTEASVTAESDGAGASAVGWYPALVDVSPAVRAQRLCGLLHWQRSLPESEHTRESVTLEQCLASLPGSRREAAIEAYWRACECAARYQVHVQQVEQLAELFSTAAEFRHREGGPEAMLRLELARRSAEADRLDAEFLLEEAQFALTQAAGRPLDGEWLLPSTSPHGGGYALKTDRLPTHLANAPSLARRIRTVPIRHAALMARADAVVEFDADRALAAARYSEGDIPVDVAIDAIDQQTRATLALLATQTDYNREIAGYVLAVVPAETPAAELVESLVVLP